MSQSLYITNYCDKRCSPADSLTKLPVSDAYSLAKELSQYTSTTFTSFSRFCDRDFDGYYKKRIRTEEWLYSSFIALGGNPQSAHPIYFVLGESTYLNQWFDHGLQTKLLLNDIDPADISFTFGDSMSIMDSADRMNPFTKESLFQFIHETTSDITSFLKDLDQKNRYIEAQLWNDTYVKQADIITK
ncbi:hypothetical protein [Paenibacillus pedocola]|uniref:hypothetical protein n=1 Tax=Paenibacillus pedocola TaxID=3242193 RepID=UPI0028773EC6|nr:hypothetical protein [Paenibacillus typhae]